MDDERAEQLSRAYDKMQRSRIYNIRIHFPDGNWQIFENATYLEIKRDGGLHFENCFGDPCEIDNKFPYIISRVR